MDFQALDGSVDLSFTPLPPLRRTWFLSKDGRYVVQLQGDGFFFNWKRTPEDLTSAEAPGYPSYQRVIADFDRLHEVFLSFIDHHELGALNYRQFELSYINHIGQRNGLDVVGRSGVLVDHIRLDREDRFLPEPSAFIWRSEYVLPDNNGKLFMTAQTAVHTTTREELLRLDLSAKGLPAGDAPGQQRKQWFDLAHDWITHGFADATSKALHAKEFWSRTQ